MDFERLKSAERKLKASGSEFPHYNRDGQRIGLAAWGALIEDPSYRMVARSRVAGSLISTVWVGINHNFTDSGPPLIFETAILEGPLKNEVWRYATEREAFEGHVKAVELVHLDAQFRAS